MVRTTLRTTRDQSDERAEEAHKDGSTFTRNSWYDNLYELCGHHG